MEYSNYNKSGMYTIWQDCHRVLGHEHRSFNIILLCHNNEKDKNTPKHNEPNGLKHSRVYVDDRGLMNMLNILYRWLAYLMSAIFRKYFMNDIETHRHNAH